jgi:hypothetical protein
MRHAARQEGLCLRKSATTLKSPVRLDFAFPNLCGGSVRLTVKREPVPEVHF